MNTKWNLSAIAACLAMIGGLIAEETPNTTSVDPRDEQIAKLEKQNALLRAELILLKNKLAQIERVEVDRASDVEKRARAAIEQLLPNLQLAPNPDGRGLPQLRLVEPRSQPLPPATEDSNTGQLK